MERDAKGRIVKGAGGRPKGTPNKLTVKAKEAFQMAFDNLGGVEGMVKWAKADPDNLKVFYTLYSKLIPMDVTSNGKAVPAPVIVMPDPSQVSDDE